MTSKNTFLWQLTLAPDFHASYLLGTMHVKDARAFVMEHHLMELIQSVSCFAAETDIREMREMTNPASIMIPEGKRLQDFYSDKQYLKIRKMLKKAFGLDIDRFQHFLPFFIAGLVDEAILSKDMPFSLDEALWRFAGQSGKELQGIESFRVQLDIMEKIPLEVQAKQLSGIAKNVSAHRRHTLKLTELYVKGDIGRLHCSAKQGLGKLRQLMLWQRNAHMAERIFELIQHQPAFCALGAGHLWGKKGVLKFLKDKGVVLTPLPWGNFSAPLHP